VVFGIIALIGTAINPIWIFGPRHARSGDGRDAALRYIGAGMRPAAHAERGVGHPRVHDFLERVHPCGRHSRILFTGMALYPFIEAFGDRDKREHNLLERPRNAPVGTGIGVMAIVFYGLLWIGGGNDIIATAFNLSINSISWTLRISLILLPPIAFYVTKRICLGLQRRDREEVAARHRVRTDPAPTAR
jgi:ubiquinol-cytochrome c reductase cytochrome b subunit